LATGDFRYDPAMFVHSPLSEKEVDICYLDNTYFNPIFAAMPTREQAMTEIIRVVDECRKKYDKKCIVNIKLKRLGKEEILAKLAEHFKTQILVGEERYSRLVNALGLPASYFVTESDAAASTTSFICVYEIGGKSSNQANSAVSTFNTTGKVEVFVEPSALVMASVKSKQFKPNQAVSFDTNVFRIAYSDHSSYTEIVQFVKRLRPKHVVPIVNRPLNETVCVANIKELQKFLSLKPLPKCGDKYKLLLQSSTSIRKSSRLMSFKINEPPARYNIYYLND
jgi:hypothetical protein